MVGKLGREELEPAPRSAQAHVVSPTVSSLKPRTWTSFQVLRRFKGSAKAVSIGVSRSKHPAVGLSNFVGTAGTHGFSCIFNGFSAP